jgi:plasmid stability protein
MPRQLHIRLNDDLDQLLQVYASARGISIAAAVRILLHEALKDHIAADT